MQGVQISPAELISRQANKIEKAAELFLVTGKRGAGKTTWCLELRRQARAAGVQPLGLISPAVFEQGMKTGIDLIDLASGERRRLAVNRHLALYRLPKQPGLAKRDWLFDPEALAWGNQILEGLQHGELLILDELGPLELLEDEGLTAGMALIDEKRFGLTCVVVRPTLVPTALQLWPWGQVLWTADQPVGRKQQ